MHFSAQGHFLLWLFLYFSLSLFCSLLWSPVIIYKLCLSLLPLNYHQGSWEKCRIPGPNPDLLLQNLLYPKTLGLCVHTKIRLERISFSLTLFGCLNQIELFRCLPNTNCSSLVFRRQIIKGPISWAHFECSQVNVCLMCKQISIYSRSENDCPSQYASLCCEGVSPLALLITNSWLTTVDSVFQFLYYV